MTEQEREEMLKDRKALADRKGVSYLDLYCGNCEHGKELDEGYVTCEYFFNHVVEYYSYCVEWAKRKDMVEVVRCKDCKWIDLCKDPEHYEYKGANGFCSKGKRKDEVEE